MRKPFLLFVLSSLLALCSVRAELVLAENGAGDYQIVIPDAGAEEIVDLWLRMSAGLVQAAFQTNGCPVDVVREGARNPDKPGIYLGATRLAQANGVSTGAYDDWTYHLKAVGRDLVIAGNDRKDPVLTVRGTETPLALLGTVKGVCDFLREFAGVRFLFLNMSQSQYATRAGGLEAFNEDGSLRIDTRSIAFLPTPRIALPEGVDRTKKPLMRANFDGAYETFYYIANNFFPRLSHLLGADVRWYEAVPPAKYAKSNPDYFALQADGRRACDLKLPYDHHTQYCVTHPGVQDLMARAIEARIKAGDRTIPIGTMDAFRLCRCNCERCNSFFGMPARTGEEYRARGHSGKLWQAFFQITGRFLEKHPDVRFVILNYQDTPVNAGVIREFPENVIVKKQFAAQHDFDCLEGVRIPAGICGFEETFTGFGQAGRYLPERTPEHIAGVVQAMARNNVQWTSRDGALGNVRGLQAPAYYVYGRMMDDPSADWRTIQKEFCEAAFGDVAPTLTGFYDQLHSQIAIYSDYYGVMMPGWNRKYARARYRESKWHVMGMYPPEYLADADSQLASAERRTKDPDVKARLHLLRIEFDYLRGLSRIFHLHSAWLLNRAPEYLNPLVDAIDEWHAELRRLSGEDGRSAFKPLDDWPEMRPFNGHHYSHAALLGDAYQQQWRKACINWDTAAIRAGILAAERRLPVPAVGAEPGLDAAAWEQAPEQVLRVRGDMPFTNVRTTFRALRDAAHLYVRLECLYPSKHPEDLFSPGRDGNVFKEDHVELGIQPPNAGGKVFRLASNPASDALYDAVLTPAARNRMSEDKTWNGNASFAFAMNLEKGRWNQSSRIYTAWFKIPFADLGAAAPAAGEVWGFNVLRDRAGQRMLWSDGPGAADPASLGQLSF